MRRARQLVSLVVTAAACTIGCGGSSDSGTGPGGNRIMFVHQWLSSPNNSNLLVTIEACSQEFMMDPGTQRLVECVPAEELPTVLVRVEGWIEGLSWISDKPTIWEGQVSGRQTVTITGEGVISVAVED